MPPVIRWAPLGDIGAVVETRTTTLPDVAAALQRAEGSDDLPLQVVELQRQAVQHGGGRAGREQPAARLASTSGACPMVASRATAT